MARTLDDILTDARRMGLTPADLLRAAGMAESWLRDRKRYGTAARSLVRLDQALGRLKLAQAPKNNGELAVNAAYRAILALSAQALSVDPAQAQASAPAKRATGSPDWTSAADARRLALYLMNTGLGFSQSDLGRVCGMTKQAISLAMRDTEDRMDDPEFETLAERLAGWLTGNADAR